jgi:hypothetical protein
MLMLALDSVALRRLWSVSGGVPATETGDA